jgi:hypothetical protein
MPTASSAPAELLPGALGLLAAYLLYVACAWLTRMSFETSLYALSLMLLGSFLYSAWSWGRAEGEFFNPYILFLVAFFLFNGGQTILVLAGADNGLDNYFEAPLTIPALSYIVGCFVCFHLGAVLSRRSRKQGGPARPDERSANAVYGLGVALFLIAIGPTLIKLKMTYGIVQSAGYGALFQESFQTANLGDTPSSYLVTGIIFMLAGSMGIRKRIIVSLSCLAFHSSVLMLMGMRGHAFMPAIGYAWVWHRLVRPIPLKWLAVALALVFFVVFPMVGADRSVPLEERAAGTRTAGSSVEESPVVSILKEVGGSMQVTTFTMELVPSVRPYDLGLSYLLALTTLFPNLFWDVHPAMKSLPGQWVTQCIDPWFDALGGSFGYSFVAESYLNFGWFGLLAAGLTGFAYARSVLWATGSGDPAKIATLAVIMSYFLFYARNETAIIARQIVWNCLIPYWLLLYLNRRRRGTSDALKPSAGSAGPGGQIGGPA